MKREKRIKKDSGTTNSGTEKSRKLVLIDIDNLCGTNRIYSEDVVKAREYLAEHAGVSDTDMIVIGTSCTQNSFAAKIAWVRADVKNVNGKDGAEKALVASLRGISGRLRTFSEVVIASGDHYFAEVAEELAQMGVMVAVVSQARCMSRSLAAAASTVQFAPDLIAYRAA